MAAYDPSEWHDLFVASAGAAAALAGLVFVAVSINLDRILKGEGLPDRALQTVLIFLSVVVVSVLGLFPGQSHTALGAELTAVALFFGAFITRLGVRSRVPAGSPTSWVVGRVVLIGAATLPFLIGAITLLADAGGGLYWIGAGVILSIGAAVANAWVLLVEILR